MNQNNKEISQEHEELQLSFPAGLSSHLLALPADYFVKLPAQILEAVQVEITLARLPKQLLFLVPNSYFNNLADTINQRLLAIPAAEEITELSPLLAGLKGKLPFERPEQFKEQNRKARLIEFPIEKRAEQRIKWTRWVAAAAIVCILSLGGYNFISQPIASNQYDASIQAALAQIPEQAIRQYLDNNMDDYDAYSLNANSIKISRRDQATLNSLSDKEIEIILEN